MSSEIRIGDEVLVNSASWKIHRVLGGVELTFVPKERGYMRFKMPGDKKTLFGGIWCPVDRAVYAAVTITEALFRFSHDHRPGERFLVLRSALTLYATDDSPEAENLRRDAEKLYGQYVTG